MELLAGLRTFSLGAIALRLLSALVCGAMVGVDRELRNKRAGLKTHVLVCLGAALCVIVSECIILGRQDITTDGTRIAANVVTGVGFLCAATLITKRNGSLHGLTTAAGLWTSAVIGLACGSGWVEVGIMASLIVLFVFFVLGRVDAYLTGLSRGFDLYVEVTDYDQVSRVFDVLHEHDVQFGDLEILKSPVGTIIVRLCGLTPHMGEKGQLAETLRALDCVRFLEMTS